MKIKLNKQASDYWDKVNAWATLYQPTDRGLQYAFDVVYSTKYVSCQAMINSCKRTILYLYRSIHEPDFPLVYNTNRVNWIADFFPAAFELKEGAFNAPFKLYDTQVYKLTLIFGFEYKKQALTGVVQMMTKYIFDIEARKQGKSIFYSALGIIVALNVWGFDFQPEIYYSGPIQDTSDILYQKSKQMITQNEELISLFDRVNLHRIETKGHGIIRKLPYKKEALEGKNHSMGVATEYHLHKTDLMVESFESADNESRPNSFIVFDTTKGTNIVSPAFYREREYKEFIEEQIKNPQELMYQHIATYIAELDEEDDIEDSSKWAKANPMMGITISEVKLKQEWSTAKFRPEKRVEFITKKLGRWYSKREGLYAIDDLKNSDDLWRSRYQKMDFTDKNCFITVDLAQSGDTNGVSLIFRDQVDDKDIIIIKAKTIIPKETLDARIELEKAPYLSWLETGDVILSGKRSVDYGDIARLIKSYLNKYDVKKILYDPYQFSIIQNLLVNVHKVPEYKFEAVPQSFKEVSSAMDSAVSKIKNQEVYYFANPVIPYQFLNVSPKFNNQGYMLYDKVNDRSRIDLFVTFVLGVRSLSDLRPLTKKKKSGVQILNF